MNPNDFSPAPVAAPATGIARRRRKRHGRPQTQKAGALAPAFPGRAGSGRTGFNARRPGDVRGFTACVQRVAGSHGHRVVVRAHRADDLLVHDDRLAAGQRPSGQHDAVIWSAGCIAPLNACTDARRSRPAGTRPTKNPACGGVFYLSHGARERTRTSTELPPLAPEASASTNSATRATQGAHSADVTAGCQMFFQTIFAMRVVSRCEGAHAKPDGSDARASINAWPRNGAGRGHCCGADRGQKKDPLPRVFFSSLVPGRGLEPPRSCPR